MLQTKNVSFTTSSSDEDLLYNEAVKEKVMELFKVTDAFEYDKLVANGIILSLDIFCKDTKVSVNGESYNDLIENTIYNTSDTRIRSLRIKDSGVVGTISFRKGGAN